MKNWMHPFKKHSKTCFASDILCCIRMVEKLEFQPNVDQKFILLNY